MSDAEHSRRDAAREFYAEIWADFFATMAEWATEKSVQSDEFGRPLIGLPDEDNKPEV